MELSYKYFFNTRYRCPYCSKAFSYVDWNISTSKAHGFTSAIQDGALATLYACPSCKAEGYMSDSGFLQTGIDALLSLYS